MRVALFEVEPWEEALFQAKLPGFDLRISSPCTPR